MFILETILNEQYSTAEWLVIISVFDTFWTTESDTTFTSDLICGHLFSTYNMFDMCMNSYISITVCIS